ncbi:conserved hypothetical protein [Formosa agariphila KMM 3901]|uniref:DUF4625 domain-containing protein n=1 Tax=Formosa agariphila (strain DSM 15362 / KCTC 12365 / LMG 23005 / KMM 3901 / M-2Alg 35-1) TaxID=1347342 RepID=T2KN46_FORAG|nr:hypothetical protein [Formosa agariphila]CDF80180.1 conserved hypothetical protein [Formosa agariphila KMM 3901]
MKKSIIYILIVFIGILNIGCSDEVGYLDIENAEYLPNTLTIRMELDTYLDALRIENQSPWVSQKISGVLGTEPLVFSVETVRSENVNQAGVDYFLNHVSVQGLGQVIYPLNTDTTPGTYIVSIRIDNAGDYSGVVEDALTITVE